MVSPLSPEKWKSQIWKPERASGLLYVQKFLSIFVCQVSLLIWTGILGHTVALGVYGLKSRYMCILHTYIYIYMFLGAKFLYDLFVLHSVTQLRVLPFIFFFLLNWKRHKKYCLSQIHTNRRLILIFAKTFSGSSETWYAGPYSHSHTKKVLWYSMVIQIYVRKFGVISVFIWSVQI